MVYIDCYDHCFDKIALVSVEVRATSQAGSEGYQKIPSSHEGVFNMKMIFNKTLMTKYILTDGGSYILTISIVYIINTNINT